MCALREPLGDLGRIKIYALLFIIVIIIFIIYYHNLLFTAQADVKPLFSKEAGCNQKPKFLV